MCVPIPAVDEPGLIVIQGIDLEFTSGDNPWGLDIVGYADICETSLKLPKLRSVPL
jgi:hypothetical protein